MGAYYIQMSSVGHMFNAQAAAWLLSKLNDRYTKLLSVSEMDERMDSFRGSMPDIGKSLSHILRSITIDHDLGCMCIGLQLSRAYIPSWKSLKDFILPECSRDISSVQSRTSIFRKSRLILDRLLPCIFPVRVSGVTELGPAYRSGVRSGDHILAINGYHIHSFSGKLSSLLNEHGNVVLTPCDSDYQHQDNAVAQSTSAVNENHSDGPYLQNESIVLTIKSAVRTVLTLFLLLLMCLFSTRR